jgi:hydantoinase/carbamoylase family amidase
MTGPVLPGAQDAGESPGAQPAALRDSVLELAQFGQVGPSAVTRLAFTADDEAAHRFIAQRMRELGLRTRTDAFGNLFGRRDGTDDRLAPILTGSHLDGPPDGGMFDGTVGVLCALEVVRLMNEREAELAHPLEVVAIRCEHLDRFGMSCLGSRALSGKLEDRDLDRLRDAESGETLREAVIAAGYLREPLETARLSGQAAAFLELHIEQGRVLEDGGDRLGVVSAIAGPTRFQARLRGIADHSGGTPMRIRHDALCGAAEVILLLERLASETTSSVGTIGVINAKPGALHTIPGTVEFGVDIRGVDGDEKSALAHAFELEMKRIAQRRRLELEYASSVDERPVPCSRLVRAAVRDGLAEAGLAFVEMASGGGHDTQHLAACTEAGMIFVPSIGGISHTPEERTSWQDLARGADALDCALRRLDVSLPTETVGA